MQNIVTLGEINDALKIAAVSAAQLADMGFAALANKPICEGLPPEESRRLRNAKLYPAESIGQIRVALAQRLAAPATMQASVSNATCQAAPAAVAVPDERAAFEAKFRNLDLSQKPDAWGHARYSHDAISLAWEAWQARAALAATPAATESREELAHRLIGEVKTADSIATAICQRVAELGDRSSPEDWPEAMLVTGDELHLIAREAVIEAQETSAAAAPVVLPEPVAFLHTLHDKQHKKVWFTRSNESGGVPVFTEQQLRALLATATGLPAQADTPDSFREWFAKNYPADTIIVDPDWHAKSIFRMAQAHARLAAPQAQADARDAVERGEVLVTVSGFTGCGKSAVAGEIEIMCRALGLQVEWPDGTPEKNMTHADWTEALELYKPRVRIVERNVPNQANGVISK